MKTLHKIMAIAYALIGIIGGGYSLFQYFKFTSYAPITDILGIVITLVVMGAIFYMAKVHWKISQTQPGITPEKTLSILSPVNIILFIILWRGSSTCDEMGCIGYFPIIVLLIVTFIITLVKGHRIQIIQSIMDNGG